LKRALETLQFVQKALKRGDQAALVTITAVTGGSSRSPGTHIAVAGDATYYGSVSGGCVEAAVVGEALRIIATGRPEIVRFGEGSRYIDIRLPCGGGLDLLFHPQPSMAVIGDAIALLESRQSVGLALDPQGDIALCSPSQWPSAGWEDGCFLVTHQPDLQLVVVGHGLETEVLARLASSYGAKVIVLTPDAGILERVKDAGFAGQLLKTPAATASLQTDRNTAVVFLFHDHDWEADLIAQALRQDAFFIGAMGSRLTHQARLEKLRGLGCTERDLARLIGPIGMIPAARDADTLALSTLAQIVERYGSGQLEVAHPSASAAP
jgi:xanthine dehydrogenase accessory factor